MKKVFKLLIIIVALFTSISAYAVDGDTAKNYKGRISYQYSLPSHVGYNCYLSSNENCAGAGNRRYTRQKGTLTLNGKQYPAYCILNVDAHPVSNAAVTCELVDPGEMPMTYALAQEYYGLYYSNHEVADLVFRITGAIEKGGASGGMGDSNTARNFQTTWKYRVQSDDSMDAYNDEMQYVLHDVHTYYNRDGFRKEPGVVQDAANIMKNAISGGGGGGSAPSSGIKDGNGSIFKMTAVAGTHDRKKGTQEYDIKVTNGKVYEKITIVAELGSYEWVTDWNGTSGRIRVYASPIDEYTCKAIITIKPGAEKDSGSPGGPGGPVEPPPTCMETCCLNKTGEKGCHGRASDLQDCTKECNFGCSPKYDACKCKCNDNEVCKMVNKRHTIPSCAANPQCEWRILDKGEGHCLYKGGNDYDECPPGEKVVYYGEPQCIDKNRPMSSSTTNYDSKTDFKYDIGTEHELVFDNGYAINTDYDDSNGMLLEGETGDEDDGVKVLYCYTSGAASQQSFIALVDDSLSADTFELDIPCSCDGDCPAVPHYNEYKEVEVHNCCDEDATSYGRQYGMKELFCDYKENGLSVPEYAERCHAEEYLDKREINTIKDNVYCAQYCSAAFSYTLPAPTHSKANHFFRWDKSRKGVSGPVLEQYHRCRTLIKFNDWYKDYADEVDKEVAAYNKMQRKFAHAKMWNDMIEDNATTSIPDYSIECTKVWAKCTAYDGTNCKNAAGCDVEETGPKKPVPGITTINYYPVKDYKGKDAYKYPVLKRLADEKKGQYTFSKIVYDKSASPSEDKADIYYDDNLLGPWKDALSKAYTEAQADSNYTTHTECTSTPTFKCKANGSEANKATDIKEYNYEGIDAKNQRKTYVDDGNTAFNEYIAAITQVTNLKDNIELCGGKFNGDEPDGSVMKERVKFENEPEMDFGYTQDFIADDGQEKHPKVSIPFAKVDEGGNFTGKCIQKEESGFETGGGSIDSYVEGSEYYDDNYDQETFSGTEIATYIDMINDDIQPATDAPNFKVPAFHNTPTVKHEEPYDLHVSEEPYKASEKFTTDAMAHMKCYWTDAGTQPEYVLVPSGVIILEPDKAGQLCDLPDYNCVVYNKQGEDGEEHTYTNNGTYFTAKGHIGGKFETYFSLKNICDGLFDDVIEEKGVTCSGKNGRDIEMVLDDGSVLRVNTTCYIEISQTIMELRDCSNDIVVDANAASKEICCNGEKVKDYDYCDGTKVPQSLFEYKVVDTSNMFPNKAEHKDGYAHNWFVDPDGKKEYEEMTKDGKADKTYDRENLTYSFTLTPKDLRAIREYNKTRIALGGYNDFNLYCDGDGGSEPLTKCKSRFIEAISGGTMDVGSYKLSIKTNNMDLNAVRTRW